jgi:lipopolysaccharide biosynthesis glycosyltransferase
MINNRLKLLTLEVKYKNIKINLVESEEPFVKIKNYKSNYYKLYLPSLIHNYDKIIFLNYNTMIFEDLEELFNIDLKDNYFLGFLNNDNNTYNNLNLTVEKNIKTNVLLINIKKLKENNYQKEFKNLYIKYKGNKEMNEEIMINILFKDNIGILPAKYGMPNFNNSDVALEYNKNITDIYRSENKDYISAYFKPTIIEFICKP